MLCKYLNEIYIDHIHKSLLGDEFNYSQEVIEFILTLPNLIKSSTEFSNVMYYFDTNNNVLFERWGVGGEWFIEYDSELYFLIFKKYGTNISDDELVYLINKHLKNHPAFV